LERAQAAVTKIEAGMAWAQRTGVLHEFNQEHRRRPLEAQGRDVLLGGPGSAAHHALFGFFDSVIRTKPPIAR
jgi:hypothetical protein